MLGVVGGLDYVVARLRHVAYHKISCENARARNEFFVAGDLKVKTDEKQTPESMYSLPWLVVRAITKLQRLHKDGRFGINASETVPFDIDGNFESLTSDKLGPEISIVGAFASLAAEKIE